MTNQMPERIKIARMGISYVCPAWDKDEHATEYVRADLAQKTVTMKDIAHIAIESGFMLSTQYGESEGKLIPVSDFETILRFAKAIIAAGVVKVSDEK